MHLFSNVKYHASSTLSLDDLNIIESILDANGAAMVALAAATHIISTSLEFDGWQNAEKDVVIVTVSLSFYNDYTWVNMYSRNGWNDL
jgi:hypothetical protein